MPTVIWAIGCIAVALPFVFMIFAGDIFMFVIGLFLIAIVGFLCIPILNWQLSGYETVTINEQGIKILRSASTNEKDKQVNKVDEIVVMPTEHEIGGKWSWLRPATVSTFHIGRIGIKQIDEVTRFGSGLTEAEAQDILATIRAYQVASVTSSKTE